MIRAARTSDLPSWRRVAREVEPLFGPMADDDGFLTAIGESIRAGNAFAAVDDRDEPGGFVALDRRANEISWLAVSASARGRGLGRSLVRAALDALDGARPVTVVTFAPESAEGAAARALYLDENFADTGRRGVNPAGVATIVMQRPAALPKKES